MKRRSYKISLRMTLLVASVISLVAQTQHITPFTGTWKLNAAKSTFGSGPQFKSLVLTYAPDGSFIREVVEADGKAYRMSFPWSGETEVPIEGDKGATILSKYHGDRVDHTLKQDGKTITVVHSVVSPDGKTLRTTVTNQNQQTLVFEKQ